MHLNFHLPQLYKDYLCRLPCFLIADDGYDSDNDGVVIDVDSEPGESFYGPKIPRTKKLKKDGQVVDTNFLACLATMREANVGSDSEWSWDSDG